MTVRSPAAKAGNAANIRATPTHGAPLLLREFTAASIVAIVVGDFRRFTGQLHDIQSAPHSVAAITQSTIIDVRVVAGYIQRSYRDAIDHRTARLRKLVHRRDKMRDFLRMVGIADVSDANAGVEPGAREQSAVGRIFKILGRRVDAETCTA